MNREEANKAIGKGAIAGCISGVLTAAIALFAVYSDSVSATFAYFNDPLLIVDIVLIFTLSYGVYKKSRTAASILFVYFIFAKLVIAVDTGNIASQGVGLLFLYFYGNAIRGTIAFHKIEKTENPKYEVRRAIPIAGAALAVLLESA